ncbi:MAG: small multi-drug export protein [Eubacteriales bacterium]|nr:small multi-drug export protein [Eubacteriales bacterium]
MESIVSFFTNNLSNFATNEIIIFIVSLFPILELRGGLLAASPSFLNVDFQKAIIICIFGNLLPIPFILLFIRKILCLMEAWNYTKPIVIFLKKKVDNKKDIIEKYGFWGLILFVSIPLPGTGAWTGALIASLLHMEIKRTFIAIVIGVLIASAIVSLISYGLLPKII